MVISVRLGLIPFAKLRRLGSFFLRASVILISGVMDVDDLRIILPSLSLMVTVKCELVAYLIELGAIVSG